LLACALAGEDQIQEAMLLLDEAIAMVRSNGERYYEPELYRLKGELLRKSPEAEQCFEQSIRLAQAQNAKSWELRAALSLAHLYQSQNKEKEARECVARVFDGFTEGFDTADLKEAKALLATKKTHKIS
jgi:predicted ATPase